MKYHAATSVYRQHLSHDHWLITLCCNMYHNCVQFDRGWRRILDRYYSYAECNQTHQHTPLSSHHHHLSTTSSQSPNRDRPAELHCRGTVSVEQSSGCSTQSRDDTAHFQATTQGLSVPHLMCWRTKETSITGRCCCGVFCDSGAVYKTADRLTYLHTFSLFHCPHHQHHSSCYHLPVRKLFLNTRTNNNTNNTTNNAPNQKQSLDFFDMLYEELLCSEIWCGYVGHKTSWLLDNLTGGNKYQGSQGQEVKFQDQIYSRFQDIFVGFTRLKTRKMHVFLCSQILIS